MKCTRYVKATVKAKSVFGIKTLFSSPPVWVVFHDASNEKLFKYDKHVHDLIRDELTPEKAKENELGFSRKTFLHLLKERDGVLTGISFVETPYVQFKIVKGRLANSYRIADTGRDEASDGKLWLYFETPFRPDKAGIIDFLKNRSIEGDSEKQSHDTSEHFNTLSQHKFGANMVHGGVDDPDFRALVAVWLELPEHIKAAIKALIQSYNTKAK